MINKVYQIRDGQALMLTRVCLEDLPEGIADGDFIEKVWNGPWKRLDPKERPDRVKEIEDYFDGRWTF